MRTLVESLKRLYNNSKKITADKIKDMSVLTEEEKRYILGTEFFEKEI